MSRAGRPKTASKIADVSLWWVVACWLNQLVRVLKRQNWALSAPTVEKIGGVESCKKCQVFHGYLTHICVYWATIDALADGTTSVLKFERLFY